MGGSEGRKRPKIRHWERRIQREVRMEVIDKGKEERARKRGRRWRKGGVEMGREWMIDGEAYLYLEMKREMKREWKIGLPAVPSWTDHSLGPSCLHFVVVDTFKPGTNTDRRAGIRLIAERLRTWKLISSTHNFVLRIQSPHFWSAGNRQLLSMEKLRRAKWNFAFPHYSV